MAREHCGASPGRADLPFLGKSESYFRARHVLHKYSLHLVSAVVSLSL